jgi:sugar/nucleoside kinase (ribokinase family)
VGDVPEIITIGELLVEVMRKRRGVPFTEPADFIGPFPSGAPAIFADAAAKLGAEVGMIGSVGDDGFGELILDRLDRDGVDTTHVGRTPDRSTGVAFIAYFLDDSRSFIFHMSNSAAGLVSPADVDAAYVRDAAAAHFDGSTLQMNDSMREACYRTLDLAADHDLLVSLDPNIREELRPVERIRSLLDPVVEAADLLAPTERELRLLTGIDDEQAAATQLLERGAHIVAVKKGADGASLYTPDGRVDVPPIDVYEVDPTGAGDAFAAALVVGYREGMPVERLGRFANATAGQATTMRGPMEGLAPREEIDKIIRRM